MKILCIHFKGGVGKSTTAVHVAGVLLATGGRVVVLDGDRQLTSYKFFNEGADPDESFSEVSVQFDGGASLSVAPINTFQQTTPHQFSNRIRKLIKSPYDHLVVDTTPDAAFISQVLVEVNPDLVLIPVKVDDEGGLAQLAYLLLVLDNAKAYGVKPRVKIVPIGEDPLKIQGYIPAGVQGVEISDIVPFMPAEVGGAVYRDYKYVWESVTDPDFFEIYRRITLG